MFRVLKAIIRLFLFPIIMVWSASELLFMRSRKIADGGQIYIGSKVVEYSLLAHELKVAKSRVSSVLNNSEVTYVFICHEMAGRELVVDGTNIYLVGTRVLGRRLLKFYSYSGSFTSKLFQAPLLGMYLLKIINRGYENHALFCRSEFAGLGLRLAGLFRPKLLQYYYGIDSGIWWYFHRNDSIGLFKKYLGFLRVLLIDGIVARNCSNVFSMPGQLDYHLMLGIEKSRIRFVRLASAHDIKVVSKRVTRSVLESEPYFLWVGRFIPSRYLDDTLHAFAIYRARGGQSRLKVAGDGSSVEEKRLRILVKELSITDSVDFEGMLNFGELEPLYQNAIGLLNLFSGASLIEAAQFELPVIVYANELQQDLVIDGFSGLQADFGDFQTIAEWMMQLERDVEFSSFLGGNLKDILGTRKSDVLPRALQEYSRKPSALDESLN